MRFRSALIGAALLATVTLAAQGPGGGAAPAQGPGGPGAAGGRGGGQGGPGGAAGGRGGFGGPAATLPTSPTAVALPTVSAMVTGPGAMYESVQSLEPGKEITKFKYEAREYFISGTAQGQPYKTRMVIRRPSSNSKFSGLVMVEPMHPSGSAHMFEFTAIYTMTSGHAAIDVVAGGLADVVASNPERYKDLKVAGNQTSDVLAQVGALMKSKEGAALLGGSTRKVVLAGTSATSATLVAYLPAHAVYRTPDMQRIYDGFLPTSNGQNINKVDVPMVHVPTQREFAPANITTRPDGDAPGDQYRVYEYPGMGHVDTHHNVRLIPNPCKYALSTFPDQAYMAVALHHLYQWVDKGIVPPKADRVVKNGANMVLDEHGNPTGGVRSPYVDVPVTKYSVPNEGAVPVIANASAYVAKGGQQAANQMCGLSNYQTDFSKDELKRMYGTPKNYRKKVEESAKALEKTGWSLPVYRDFIMADAAKIEF